MKNMNFLTYEVTLDEFELEVIRKMVEDMPESMSMTIEEGVNFGIMLQIVEKHFLGDPKVVEFLEQYHKKGV